MCIGRFAEGEVGKEGLRLNTGLRSKLVNAKVSESYSLSLFGLDKRNIEIDCIKWPEDKEQGIVVLRMHENLGETTVTKLTNHFGEFKPLVKNLVFGNVKGTNILEDDYAPEYSQDIIEWKSDYVILRFKPYQIITLRILLVTQDL